VLYSTYLVVCLRLYRSAVNKVLYPRPTMMKKKYTIISMIVELESFYIGGGEIKASNNGPAHLPRAGELAAHCRHLAGSLECFSCTSQNTPAYGPSKTAKKAFNR
jgi:hypothetical protein